MNPSGLIVDLETPLDAGFDLAMQFEATAPITVLFGASGSGKSATLELVAGLRRPRRGRIQLGTQTILDTNHRIDRPASARRIGWVPQDALLFPHLRVRDNLLFGRPRREPHRFDPAELSRFLEIDGLLDRRPVHLSGGERQRVAFGRALLAEPHLVLADEPFSGLDRPLARRLHPLVRQIAHELGVPILLVAHDPEDVRAVADQVVLVEAGRVVHQGRPGELFSPGATYLDPFETHPVTLLEGTVESNGSVDVGPLRLHPARPSGQSGAQVRIEVPARDVLLTLEWIESTSALHQWTATVVGLRTHRSEVLVELDVGLPLFASVTPASVERLSLTPGSQVVALVKATSLRVLE